MKDLHRALLCVFAFNQHSTFLSSSTLYHQTFSVPKRSAQPRSASPGNPAAFLQEIQALASLLGVPRASARSHAQWLSTVTFYPLAQWVPLHPIFSEEHGIACEEEYTGKASVICQICYFFPVGHPKRAQKIMRFQRK